MPVIRKLTILFLSLAIFMVFNHVNITTANAEKLENTVSTKVITENTSEEITLDSNSISKLIEDETIGMSEQISLLNQGIKDNYGIILQLEKEMTEIKNEMTTIEGSISEIKEKVDKRNELLKERARILQQSGGNIPYIELLINSNGLDDFVTKVDSVSKMVQADQELIALQENDLKSINDLEISLDIKRNELEATKTKHNDFLTQVNELIHSIGTDQEKSDSQKDESAETEASFVMGHGYINTVISAGYKFIGNSVYVFGGGRTEEDIANGKFDCSAFVNWAFSQAGIDIGVTTDSIKDDGRQVSMEQIRPGDLVFFDTYKKDGHVGIYLGNGKFIGSQSSTGVAIADMTAGYWERTFNGRVVRIVE